MRVVCFHTGDSSKGHHRGLQQETEEALARYWPEAELVSTAQNSTAYWRALKDRWTGEDDLITIEQDNVIDERVLPAFESCDHDWCHFQYVTKRLDASERLSSAGGLGCTKFSAKLQQTITFESVPIAWIWLDVWMYRRLLGAGFVPISHGFVKHLHEYSLSENEPQPNTDRTFTSDKFGYFVPPICHGVDGELYHGTPIETGEAQQVWE